MEHQKILHDILILHKEEETRRARVYITALQYENESLTGHMSQSENASYDLEVELSQLRQLVEQDQQQKDGQESALRKQTTEIRSLKVRHSIL